jgi:LCP family protein required for cell wall assembly
VSLFRPRTRGGALWRFLLASVLVVGLTAGATAVAALLQVATVVKLINATKPLPKDVGTVLPAPGAPETLLLIGSDHRAGEPYNLSNTDTMMLVRIDDSSRTINVMSIPRDLAVTIPGPGGTYESKLNAAYSAGGVKLLVHTLRSEIFPRLRINHILDVNFAGFSDMIDAIGCVYADVDHRYYNNTELTDYSSIDIEPGYQRLCGDNQSVSGALAFVRFRHTDSDIVRNARQQDFLRWAKEGYSASELVNNRDRLLKIFGQHVQTDHSLHTTDGLIELFNLVVNADGLTVKSIHFPEYFGECTSGGQTPCYVYAAGSGPDGTLPVGEATGAEAVAFRKFMTPTIARAPAAAAPSAGSSTGAALKSGRKPGRSRPQATRAPSAAGLIADPTDGKAQASLLGRAGMPVMYPKLIVAGYAAGYCFSTTGNCDDGSEPAAEYLHSYPREYHIHSPANKAYAAYVMTLRINSALGQYYTVQGTTWRDPPIFNSPKRVVTVGRRKLFEYLDGGAIALVAYHTPRGVYWISNTLANDIPNREMVAMAASLTPAG